MESYGHIRVSVPSQPVRVEDGLGEVIASGFTVSAFLLLVFFQNEWTQFTKLLVTRLLIVIKEHFRCHCAMTY